VTVQAGDIAPDFEQDTINGSIRFHEWMGRSWCILFSANELADMARLKPEWARRGIKVVGLVAQPNDGDAASVNFPVIADADRTVSALYGMAAPDAGALLSRVYVIDPRKQVRLVRAFPPGAACDFAELLRMVDCLQLADAPPGGGLLCN
jgi:alkyl hydroperoxide reductase subunit AhpC